MQGFGVTSIMLSAKDDFDLSWGVQEGFSRDRKVDIRLPGKGNSNFDGARLTHLIMMMMSRFGRKGCQ